MDNRALIETEKHSPYFKMNYEGQRTFFFSSSTFSLLKPSPLTFMQTYKMQLI